MAMRYSSCVSFAALKSKLHHAYTCNHSCSKKAAQQIKLFTSQLKKKQN